MSRHFAHTVVRVRAPETTDRYNNKRRDWGSAERVTWTGVNMQPGGVPSSSNEDTVGRQTTVTDWELRSPRGMDLDLLETDRVEYEGMVLEVDGKVGRWRVGGKVHHCEVSLREVD